MKSLTFRVYNPKNFDGFMSICEQLPWAAKGGDTELEAFESIFEYFQELLIEQKFSSNQAIEFFEELNAIPAVVGPFFYSYKIFWSDEDNEYVAICDQFELLSYLDSDPRKAFIGLLEVISENQA